MRLFLLRYRWLLLCACGLLSGCVGSSTTPGANWLKAREWRMDNTGQQTLQEVQQASDWQSLPEWKSWGFGPETVWVRLQLKGSTQNLKVPLAVRVRPPVLDHVTLFDPASGLVLRTGDALPPDSSGLTSINFTLQIPDLPYERTVYLQIRSSSARTLQLEVMPYDQAQQHNRLQEWAMGFVVAASAMFALWAWTQWWFTRDKVIFAFAVKQAFAMVWAFFYLGFARVVIGSDMPEGLLTAMASNIFVWVASVTLWFFSVLIKDYEPWHPALKTLRLFVVLYAVLPVLQLHVPTYWMLNLANAGVLIGFVLLLFTLATAIPMHIPQFITLRVLMLYLMTYVALNSLPVMMSLGWVEAHPVMLFGLLSHVTLDGLVMFLMLQIRAHKMHKQHMQIALDLHHSQQRVEDEKRHREEQSKLFAMLAHEMKTPLATLSMWMQAGQLNPERMDRAITDMNQVIELCVHTGQLADQGLQPDCHTVDPGAITLACIRSCRNPSQVDFLAPEVAAPLQTDAQMLSIVLGNLLDNACKYGAPGSHIRLTLTPSMQNTRAGWLWQVNNTAGPAGLPDAERLFEKYYRSQRARRVSGSGLGLFLVKALLDMLQGNIHYEVLNGHAVFSFWLPQLPMQKTD